MIEAISVGDLEDVSAGGYSGEADGAAAGHKFSLHSEVPFVDVAGEAAQPAEVPAGTPPVPQLGLRMKLLMAILLA